MEIGSEILVIVLLMGSMLMMMLIYASSYKKVPPNKAMVIYGRKTRQGGPGYQVISGGGKFILPIIESYEFLSIEVRTLEFDLKDVKLDPGMYDDESPRIAIEATALVKVGSSREELMVVAEHLMGKTNEEIDHMSRKIIEGHIRTVLRGFPRETIDKERDAVAARIQMSAQQDLLNVGLDVRAFTLNRVHLKG